MKRLFTFYSNAQYSVLYNFNNNNGFPCAGLILSGNVLYGMDLGALTGPNNGGQVFSIHTDGTGFKNLLVFNGANGGYPGGNLTLSGNRLYGMTSGGNDPGLYGNVFCIDTNGNNYKDLLTFNGSDGREPAGNVTIIGNMLYGMTYIGGADSMGNIFSIHTDGSGYSDLFDFNGKNGAGPQASFTLLGNRLYAMTTYGGANGWGIIFCIDTNGKGYRDLFDFHGTDGGQPFGSLTFYSNKLYGMTNGGGVTGDGNIFSVDTNGSNYKDIFDFNDTDGEEPFGSLLYASGGLYGTVQHGGAFGDGVLFSIDTSGNNYKDLFDFHRKYGSQPGWSLVLSGNILYGMAEDSGEYYKGVIFAFKDTNGGLGMSGVKEQEGVKVYPNPNNGNFTLVIAGETRQFNSVIEVYNVLGEKVYSHYQITKSSNYQIDLSGQPNGVYLYRVITETGELVGEGKIVKE